MADFLGFRSGFEERRVKLELLKEQLKALQQNSKIVDMQNKLDMEESYAKLVELNQKRAAFDKLKDLSMPSSAPQRGMEGPPQTPEAGMSLSQILADPEGSFAALRSGMADPKDILFQQRFEKMMGGAPGGGMRDIDETSKKIAALSGDFGKLQPRKTTVQTVQTPEGARIQTIDPMTGEVIAELGEPKEEKTSAEQAGRIQGLKQAVDLIVPIMSALLEPDGSVNRMNVFNLFSKMPGTEGRKLRFQYEDAIDSVVRARTGATANETEMQKMLDQLMPSPLDNDATVKDKLKRLNSFVSGSLDIATLPPRIKKAWDKAKGEATLKSKGQGNKFRYNPETGQLEPK